MKLFIFLRKSWVFIILFFSWSADAQRVDPIWGQQLVEASLAWQNDITGDDLIIAIIDTGVDISHPQLANAIYKNESEFLNGIDDDGNGLVDDIHGWDFSSNNNIVQDDSGHGTHLAGIIASNHQDGLVLGLAPDAKILPIKFINQNGVGLISNAIASMDYAVKQGAKIVLVAWGVQKNDPRLEAKTKELSDKGILVVTAAGNTSDNLVNSPVYPAAYSIPGLISVGASTEADYFAAFSNYGSLVDLAAPGANILTAGLGGSEEYHSNTSLGSAFVAGAAALVWSKFPALNSAEVVEKILTSVEAKNFNVATGGRLSVSRALGLK